MEQSNSIKVLQINSMKNWAGGEVHVCLLCKELIDIGESIVLTCRPGSAIDQNAREANIPVFNLPLATVIDFRSAWILAKFCKENSVDIIHAHTGRDYWLAIWTKFFNPKLKIVITRHIRAPLKNSGLRRWAYKKVNKVIAVSQTVKNAITIFPSEKIAVVYNGIDVEKYSAAQPGTLRKELGISPQTKIVGMVGRVNPSKGQETFIQSIPEILCKLPDTVFVVIGGGSDEYISELKRINGAVNFLGVRNDILGIMRDLDVFVLASWNEPFGLVTVEAMAAGTPVVATNTGGTAEIIIDGESGILIPPKDPAKLAQAIIRVLTDSELAGKLKTSGMNRAKKFTMRDMAINTRKVYYDTLNSN
ncbi:glycosyltransferase family 4 protein [Sporomusa sp. KB1]|uniref:glycosyltransferase family 4 protein n=1 Tax=Sporomusa sp. KB1 TaxID=943346 RepID=UPI0011AC2196|nr:glycosyltransferase family 4 protein [Sporomusa sp. KB1]TWH45300.1 glycosyltransferase involved in cell wall biosynthesis [Sporomusa sp. KB1]